MMCLTTEVTKQLGIRLPILAGGLMWLSDADYVAAAAHAGAWGLSRPPVSPRTPT